MKLSIAIMAHPSRANFFSYLKQKLPTASWSIDEGFGIIENCRRAWLLHDPDADYHVVIQDDAIVCTDFLQKAEKILENANGMPVNFCFIYPQYLYEKVKHEALLGFLIHNSFQGGVAIALPTLMIKPMIDFYDRETIQQDDTRIGRYIKSIKEKIYIPIPSLIDHRVGETSLMWKRPTKHFSPFYIEK